MRSSGDVFTSFWASKNITNFENLKKIANRICDPALLSIPESPMFCLNSLGDWRIYDSNTIAAQVEADESYREIISEIDISHPSGVGYILEHPPINISIVDTILDKILAKWQACFDLHSLSIGSDYEIQLEIMMHEELLTKLDVFFENIINSSMPQNLRNLLKLNVKTEKTLKAISKQLDKLESSKFRENAFRLLIDRIDNNQYWKKLVTYTEDDLQAFVTKEELKVLLNHFISVMVDCKFIKKNQESFSLLHNHLNSRRLAQNELRTNADGSLKTQTTNPQELYSLSQTEIRDPSNRGAYINLTFIEDATDFRDIIVAATLLFDARFNIISIEEKILTRKFLLANLGAKYKQARDEKSNYFPTNDELLALDLEQIDDFVQDKYVVGGMDYINSAVSKLKSFLQGDKLGLSDSQLRIFQEHNLAFLKILLIDKKPRAEANSQSLSCYSILGKRRGSLELIKHKSGEDDKKNSVAPQIYL